MNDVRRAPDPYKRATRELFQALRDNELSYDDPPELPKVYLRERKIDKGDVYAVHKDGHLKVIKHATAAKHYINFVDIRCAYQAGKSPFVVGINGGGLNAKGVWFEMDYFKNGTLQDLIVLAEFLLSVRKNSSGHLGKTALPYAVIKIIVIDLACSIIYIHSKRVAHRDIKHENILITNFLRFCLGDFDLGYILSWNKLMSTSCGNRLFGNPKVFDVSCRNKGEEGEEGYNEIEADIWNLGTFILMLVDLWNNFEYDLAHKLAAQRAKWSKSNNKALKEQAKTIYKDKFLRFCFEANPARFTPEVRLAFVNDPIVKLAIMCLDAVMYTKEIVQTVADLHASTSKADLDLHFQVMTEYETLRSNTKLGPWTIKNDVESFYVELDEFLEANVEEYPDASALITLIEDLKVKKVPDLIRQVRSALAKRGPHPPPVDLAAFTAKQNENIQQVLATSLDALAAIQDLNIVDAAIPLKVGIPKKNKRRLNQ